MSTKDLGLTPMGSPLTGARQIQMGWVNIAFSDHSILLSLRRCTAENLCSSATMVGVDDDRWRSNMQYHDLCSIVEVSFITIAAQLEVRSLGRNRTELNW